MKELKSLIEALAQYDKTLAKSYVKKMNKIDANCNDLKKEIESIIKKHRWQISESKREDEDFLRHFEKYFVDKEVD